jgi:ubiquinol-cytochrome c reductase cytochrome c subunit
MTLATRRTGRLLRLGLSAAVTVVVAGSLLVATGALSRAQVPSPLPSPLASPAGTNPEQDGHVIYLRDCAWCHGAQGRGTGTGPSLVGVGTASVDFMLSTGRMPIPEPEEQPQRKEPAYTPEQISALVTYLTTFVAGGPSIPRVDPSGGSLGAGAQLYEENCAACHSSTGVGGALTSGLIAPSLDRSTARQVAEAMRLGGAGYRSGHMPRFGTDTFSDQDVNAIARYVLYLEHPRNRGGFDLGHLGPVVEGFVAWVGLLLLLLLFVRWIGEKTS